MTGAGRRAAVVRLLAPLALAACHPAPRASPEGGGLPAPATTAGPAIRVAVVGRGEVVRLSAPGAWELLPGPGASGASGARRLDGGQAVEVRPASSGALRVTAAGGAPSLPASGVGGLEARPRSAGDVVMLGSRRYRGSLVVLPTDSGVLVINRVPLEEYLRGVVPIEIGHRTPAELAAVEAQAVAARSYAAAHRSTREEAGAYDVVATVMSQAYGGVDAETPESDAAIARTAGMVLTYRGRLIAAPYSSTCGGSTAAASEVWNAGDEPWLVAVSDRDPATGRAFCEASPRFTWTREFTGAELARLLARYGPAYLGAEAAGVRRVAGVALSRVTPSGRAGRLAFDTDRGPMALRGNEIRFVLRGANGAILPSTYFSIDVEPDGRGGVRTLAVHGRGNGHGVGMCQWGAIGRARAGQDVRRILATYYPGTAVARLD